MSMSSRSKGFTKGSGIEWVDNFLVESPKRFATKYMRESAIGLTGEVVLYLHDPRRRNRQAAHGSRFKVKFVRPPKG